MFILIIHLPNRLLRKLTLYNYMVYISRSYIYIYLYTVITAKSSTAPPNPTHTCALFMLFIASRKGSFGPHDDACTLLYATTLLVEHGTAERIVSLRPHNDPLPPPHTQTHTHEPLLDRRRAYRIYRTCSYKHTHTQTRLC